MYKVNTYVPALGGDEAYTRRTLKGEPEQIASQFLTEMVPYERFDAKGQ